MMIPYRQPKFTPWIEVNARVETGVPGLLAAGEAVGGANGAKRLSGNAITKALTFGRRAGRTAAELLADETDFPSFQKAIAQAATELVTANAAPLDTARMVSELQNTMSDNAGLFKSVESLARLEAREMRLEPLGNKPLVRDLVTEIAPLPEQLARHLDPA